MWGTHIKYKVKALSAYLTRLAELKVGYYFKFYLVNHLQKAEDDYAGIRELLWIQMGTSREKKTRTGPSQELASSSVTYFSLLRIYFNQPTFWANEHCPPFSSETETLRFPWSLDVPKFQSPEQLQISHDEAISEEKQMSFDERWKGDLNSDKRTYSSQAWPMDRDVVIRVTGYLLFMWTYQHIHNHTLILERPTLYTAKVEITLYVKSGDIIKW